MKTKHKKHFCFLKSLAGRTVPNIKFVSLAYMHVTKSAKSESGTTSVSMCVSVYPFVCVYLYCVCGVPNIKLVSLV